MNTWTIKRRIIVGFTAIFTLVAILTTASFFLLRQVTAGVEIVRSKSLPGLASMSEIKSKVGEIQIGLLRYLLSKKMEDKKKFEDEIAAQRQEILKLTADYEKTIVLAEDRSLFDAVTQARDSYVAKRARMFELGNAGKDDEALAFALTTIRPAYDAYQEAVNKLFAFNSEAADKSAAQSLSAATRARWITNGLSAAVIVLGVAFAALLVVGLNRALTRLAASLGDGSDQVVSAASQVSSSSQSLAEGASESAASLEETSSSLEEMSSMTQRNAANAGECDRLMSEAKRVVDVMAQATAQMAQAISEIKASSDETAKIIKTIDEIAFQTNILALNAAVEAARAGEAGAGFAVVADEVRSLAQRCAQAAKDTAAKIEESVAKAGYGVQVTAQVNDALQQNIATSGKVAQLVTEIASASREQAQGITQVNTAVGQMDKVTQSNAANAEESAAAAEELSAQAQSMKDAVSELLRLVCGRGGQSGGAVPPNSLGAPLRPTVTAQWNGGGQQKETAGRNGKAPPCRATPALAKHNRSSEIPLESDFNEF